MRLLAESQDYLHGGTQKDSYSDDEVVAVPCPLCGGGEREPICTEHGVLGVCRCRACALIYTSPRLKEPEKVYWGDEQVYYAEARLIFEGKAAHHRDPNYLAELRQIERHKRGGRLLDVGCNMGMLLRLARARGFEVTGVEPSPSLARLARRWEVRVHNCFLHELPPEEEHSFDVVALSDVFEHIAEPLAFLEQAARLLKPDGVLYVKVPNALWNLFKQRALAAIGRHPQQGVWDSYEHVVHYTDLTLERTLGRCGFRLLSLAAEPPVQTPNWHEHVGHYYQYPTPWFMDWRRKLVRSGFHRLAGLERALRRGRFGYFAQTIAAVASRG